MIKKIASFLSVLVLGSSFMFGAVHKEPDSRPPRKDQIDDSSAQALVKLNRAKHVLAKLVPDPQSYHLMLSNTTAFGGEAVPPHVYSDKPTMILYQGALAPSRSDEEVAFLMAHELSHLLLYHNENMGEMMDKIYSGPPIGISGTTVTPFYQKLQERQADLNGFEMYQHAGYDLNFFPFTLDLIKINPNIHFGTSKIFKTKQISSLSMKNSHFSILERFTLLSQKSCCKNQII